MYYDDYTAAKAQKRALEKAFRKGKLSEDTYNSQVSELDQKIKDYEAEQQLKEVGFSAAKIRNGHFVIELDCPCGNRGTVTHGQINFRLLGKDSKGFIYFECPRCKQHIQYDPLTGKVKSRKGILGLLFGRFS